MPRLPHACSDRASRIRHVLAALAIAPVLVAASSALADDEAANKPRFVNGIVTGAPPGSCYAKSVPDAYWGMKGTTKVYVTAKGKERLVTTFPWYASRLHLKCRRGPDGVMTVTVVRLGPWQRGQRASNDHLALAFYENGRELARYSTLDLAGRPDNVRPSVSHYRVIKRIKGLIAPNHFRLTLVDGRTLTFDLATGRIRRQR
jgi:hypothetical protein